MNETYDQYLRIPDAETGSNIKKSMVFIIENITHISTKCELVRKKMCQCGFKIVQSTLTRRVKVHDCPHRDLILVELSNNEILPNSIELLTVKLNYNLEGLQTVCYQMKLSHKRTVNLLFKMEGLIPDINSLSPYTWNFIYKLKNVYIGMKESDLQAYWFYNNTKKGYAYSLDISQLDAINARYGCKVLYCVNPAATIEPKSYGYIFFLFHPVDLNPIDVSLAIKYNIFTCGGF